MKKKEIEIESVRVYEKFYGETPGAVEVKIKKTNPNDPRAYAGHWFLISSTNPDLLVNEIMNSEYPAKAAVDAYNSEWNQWHAKNPGYTHDPIDLESL